MTLFLASMLGRLCDPIALFGYLGIGWFSHRWWWTLPLVIVYALIYEYLAFVMLPTNGFPNEFIVPQIVSGLLVSSALYLLRRSLRKEKRTAPAS